jgi:hypothetical protein
VAAVPGVQHDQAERFDPRLAGAGTRSFSRAVDVQDQPEGIVQGGGLDIGGHPFQHDAQEGIGAHRLEANLLHQAVVDHLDPRAGKREARQAHAHLLAPRDHRVREGAAGLDDDPGEGRIGAMAKLFEGDAALDRLRRGGLPGLGSRRNARRQLRQAFDEKILGNEPGPGAHARGGIEGDGLTLDDDAGLVADELRAALADGERGARALRAPRALEERGQLLRRDVGADRRRRPRGAAGPPTPCRS